MTKRTEFFVAVHMAIRPIERIDRGAAGWKKANPFCNKKLYDYHGYGRGSVPPTYGRLHRQHE